MATVSRKSRFILSQKSNFDVIDDLSIGAQTLPMDMLSRGDIAVEECVKVF